MVRVELLVPAHRCLFSWGKFWMTCFYKKLVFVTCICPLAIWNSAHSSHNQIPSYRCFLKTQRMLARRQPQKLSACSGRKLNTHTPLWLVTKQKFLKRKQTPFKKNPFALTRCIAPCLTKETERYWANIAIMIFAFANHFCFWNSVRLSECLNEIADTSAY